MAYSTTAKFNCTAAVLARFTALGLSTANAIVAADAEIDSHLQKRYATPLATPVPGIVETISADLALHRLIQGTGDIMTVPDWLAKAVEAHRELLKKICDGELSLGVEPTPASSTQAVASVEEREPVMTSDTLKEF